MLGGPVLSDTYWQSPKHWIHHAIGPPTQPHHPDLALPTSRASGGTEVGGELILQRENGKAPCYALRDLDSKQEQGAISPVQQAEGNSERLPGSCWTNLLSQPEQLAQPLSACYSGIRSCTRADATWLRQGRCSGNLVCLDRALSPHEKETHRDEGPPEQMTLASSPWLQLCEVHPR